MFDIGFVELALIALVLLIVVGPEKLPEVVRQGAFFMRKMSAWLTNVKSEMEMQDPAAINTLKDATREIAELKATMAKMGQEVLTDVKDVGSQMQSSMKDIEDELLSQDPREYFDQLANEDIQPRLLDDEIAGKPVEKEQTAKPKTAVTKSNVKKTATNKKSIDK